MGWFETQKPPTVPTDFGEGADDEIDVVDNALVLGDAAAVLADEAHRMRLVDQHHRARLLADADHFLERGDVAQHRIDAFKDDKLARIGGEPLEPLFERLDIIVAKGDDLGIAHRAAVVDRGVAVGVDDDVVILARERRDDPEIGLVARREDHRMVHVVEVLERVFARLVPLVRPVEHAAAGGARAEFVERLLARRDDVGIEGHAHVIVGAEQDRPIAVADRHGRRFDLFHDEAERVLLAGREQRPRAA